MIIFILAELFRIHHSERRKEQQHLLLVLPSHSEFKGICVARAQASPEHFVQEGQGVGSNLLLT